MDYSDLDQLIEALDADIRSIEPTSARWKPFWDRIRSLNASFKSTRYPTRAAKEQAWQRCQSSIERLKKIQAEANSAREDSSRVSNKWKLKILDAAYAATPMNGFEESLYAITFGLVEGAIRGTINALLPGPEVDDVKQALLRHSEKLREGWDLLTEHKTEMLGRDKKEAFEALTAAQNKLNDAWSRWKGVQEQRWQDYQERKREKKESFESHIRGNIDKLEDRIERLRGVLSHKESHLEDLEQKRAAARGDEFRGVVEGWISQEEDAIRDIRSKIENIQGWLEEERSKLR